MDIVWFKHDRTVETLRPAVLPDDRRLFLYPIAVGLVIMATGFCLDNRIMLVLPLIVLAVFPGLPVFFHLIYHLFIKIELLPDRLVVTDWVSDGFVRCDRHQEIFFSEMYYVTYLSKEINLLLNLRNRLKAFKIPGRETDYTKANLVSRHGVPEALFERFERSSQKALTDLTATGVLMRLDEICDKYDVSRETRNRIKKALTNDSNFNFEYLEAVFAGYSIDSQDLDSLIDELTRINADTVAPFLRTNVNLARYQRAENQRHGAHVTARIDNGLVLSNEDGTKKVYFTHFHDLSNRDLHRFIEVVRSRQPRAEFLMTQRELRRLLGR